ncbi:hypothetical protein PsorP6_015656 [Peronosclerospora sorghi]|uniref:Uncharacterized protein n=1 Tax=Peronosclerospora sorghi TaxID=230839 RepID=A0ACC0WN95_9STRA|nr:hypothetical protein PsorP6_015656 [Peronosclerospora sorghi]
MDKAQEEMGAANSVVTLGWHDYHRWSRSFANSMHQRSENFEDREIGWNRSSWLNTNFDTIIESTNFFYSVFYLLAAIPGSLSMLYKERTIRDQPVDMTYLNAWVSVNQFVAGLLAALLIFDAKFLHLDQKSSGLMCLIQGKNEVSTDDCYVSIACLTLLSSDLTDSVFLPDGSPSLNNLRVQQLRCESASPSTDPTDQRSTMYGCTLAVFLSHSSFWLDPDSFGTINLHDGLRNWIPPSVFVDVFAFLIIFLGKVLYQWDPDPDVEETTLSAEDKEAMSLINGDENYGLRYT